MFIYHDNSHAKKLAQDTGIIYLRYNCLFYINTGMRLADGPAFSVGRLEYFYDSKWGTFNKDSFGTSEAVTVCKQMGFQGETEF